MSRLFPVRSLQQTTNQKTSVKRRKRQVNTILDFFLKTYQCSLSSHNIWTTVSVSLDLLNLIWQMRSSRSRHTPIVSPGPRVMSAEGELVDDGLESGESGETDAPSTATFITTRQASCFVNCKRVSEPFCLHFCSQLFLSNRRQFLPLSSALWPMSASTAVWGQHRSCACCLTSSRSRTVRMNSAFISSTPVEVRLNWN